MLQKNTWAFSIILAMMLTTIMLLVAYNLLEMIVPFAKNTKWIENSSNSYYQSYAWVEESINFISKNSVWSSTWKTMPWTATWYSITMTSTWTIVPWAWKWNSEYDKNWNRIAPGEPIQLYVTWNQDWKNFKFRVPDLDWNNNWSNETLSWWILWIINWQLSWSWLTLNSSWTYIKANQIWNISTTWTTWNIDISGFIWSDLNDSSSNLLAFYNWIKPNCNNLTQKCSIKLSIINELKTTTWTPIPYLEYQITFLNSVPQQYVDINTDWKSYWFKKTINTKYRVDTTSEAFDFTVFQ